MNKAELVSAIAKRADVPASTVDSVLAGLQEELVDAITRGDKVAVSGLLTVERTQRSARTGRNPQTGAVDRHPRRQHRQGDRRLEPQEGRELRPGLIDRFDSRQGQVPPPPSGGCLTRVVRPTASWVRMRVSAVRRRTAFREASRGQRPDDHHRPGGGRRRRRPPASGSTGGWPAGWTTGSCPGFLVTVSRHGQLVHVGKSGHRDVENGLPVTDDTRWRIYSMTKPVTSVAAMMLYEEGAFELSDPISKWLPEFAELPRLRGRVRPEAGHRAADGADPGAAPAHPHVRAHLRLPPRPPGRRDVPRDGPRVGHPARRRLRRGVPAVGVGPAGLPARHRLELRRLHRRPRPARGGALRAAAGRVLRFADLRPARHAATRPSAYVRTTTSSRWPGCTRRRPGPPGGPATGIRPHRRDGRRRARPARVPVRRRRAGVHRG